MSSSSRGVELIIYALAGGPAVLAWGLSRMKEERLLQDTPLSKIRSAAMGLVALQGMAKPRREIFEPLEGAPCCWWRCQVQEYRSNGKSGSWVTIKDVDAAEMLYVQDDTGKVLVDPRGAEFYVGDKTITLNSSTRANVEPALASWGINDIAWFGLTKQMRLIETIIFPDFPLYILGAMGERWDLSGGRQERFTQRVEALKHNPQAMAAVMGQDGVVDAGAWEMLIQKEQAAFMQEESALEAQMQESDKRVVRQPEEQPFVISTESEQELARSLGYKAFFLILGGIAISAFGTWFALIYGFSREWTAAFVVGGFIGGMFISRALRNKGKRRAAWNS